MLVPLPEIASNMLFKRFFMLVCRMLTMSDFFISSVESVVKRGFIEPCSSISVFILSIFSGLALMNNFSVSFTGAGSSIFFSTNSTFRSKFSCVVVTLVSERATFGSCLLLGEEAFSGCF